jgi:hypothetical protein
LAPVVDRGRIERGSAGTAWLEERWPGSYDIAEIEVHVPTDRGAERLDHRVRVELLGDDGTWLVASELHVSESAFGERDRAPFAHDADAVAFLAERGLTVEQFEFFVEGPARASVLMMWELQGVARRDVPEAILRHLEGADDAMLEPRGEDATGAGWVHELGWVRYTERLTFPVLANAVRFSLEGGEIVGDAWQLILRTVGVPDDLGGAMVFELAYAHVW